MQCHVCGATGSSGGTRCPACGALRGVNEATEHASGDTTDRRLVADGGQPPRDDESDEEATDDGDGDRDPGEDPPGRDDAPTGGGPPDDRPSDGQRDEGQPTEPEPGSGHPRGNQAPDGSDHAGGQPDERPGGQPDEQPGGRPDGQPGGQPQGGQPTGGQPAPSGQSAGGGGQPGGQPAGAGGGGQPTGRGGGGQPGGQPAGAGGGGGPGQGGGHHRGQGSGTDIAAALGVLPWRAGSFIGLLALLVPYLLIAAATYVAVVTDELEVGAGIFLLLISFAPGEIITSLFISASDVSALRNVEPADYPSFSGELAEIVEILQTTPEALLLGLYVFAPLVLYLGGRFLASHYATGPSLLEHLRAPIPLVVGALPVVTIVAVAFPVVEAVGPVLVAGVVLPLVFGMLGALSQYAYGRYSWLASKGYGWIAVAVPLLFGVLLLTVFPILAGDEYTWQIGLTQQLILGIETFLASMGLNFVYGGLGVAIFMLGALTLIVAGYVRVVRAGDEASSVPDAARIGSSLVRGYLPLVVGLAVLLPLLTIFVPVLSPADLAESVGFDAVRLGTPLIDLGTFVQYVLVGGTLLPLLLGGLGGAAAEWNRQRRAARAHGPQGQGGQPARQPAESGSQQPPADAQN